MSSPTPERRSRLTEVLEQRQDDLTLVLANIHDPHNVSAIYRSADAFGVARVFLYYTREAFPTLGRKSSASARKWVDSVRYREGTALLDDLRARGMQILASSCSPKAIPLRQWNFLRPTAVIFGNEHDGVDAELLSEADGQLYIPMHGMIQSFNVSVAAAIVLAEAARQREDAGYYSKSSLPKAELSSRLEDWLSR